MADVAWGLLLHLSMNMWTDRKQIDEGEFLTPSERVPFHDHLPEMFDEDVYAQATADLAGAGGTMVVLDLGEATVRTCLDRGAQVAGFDIVASTALSSAHRTWQVDVADGPTVAAAVTEVNGWLGGLDAVLHVAGIVGSTASIDDLAEADWSRVIAVNLTGPYLVAKHTLPLLAESGGTLVLVGSGAGVHNAHPSVAYAAAKGGLHALALTLHEEWRERGVNVVALLPTSIDTPLVRNSGADPVVLAEQRARHRLLTADECAAVLAFLATPAGAAVRGAIRTW
ncbi:MAG TPA: SDR family oxidoreductase [Propionibacteriaceae bacterium]|nr:SDR family oxidoreductase [Propionibacteriaceae bacterium]